MNTKVLQLQFSQKCCISTDVFSKTTRHQLSSSHMQPIRLSTTQSIPHPHSLSEKATLLTATCF